VGSAATSQNLVCPGGRGNSGYDGLSFQLPTAVMNIRCWLRPTTITTRCGRRMGSPSFSHPIANGSGDLFRVDADGSRLTQLTSDAAYEDQAAFSPDGKQLVFVTTRGSGYGDLWTLDIATRRAKALTSGPGGDYRPHGRPTGNGSHSLPNAASRRLSPKAVASASSWPRST